MAADEKPRIEVDKIIWEELNPDWNMHYNPVTQTRYDASIVNENNMKNTLEFIKELKNTNVENSFKWIEEEGAKLGWGCDQIELSSFLKHVADEYGLIFDEDNYRKRMEYFSELELKELQKEQNENN
jgi:hypothetical protein